LLLRTEKLKKTFGGLIAVNEIDLSLEAGKIAAIIGPNGSGKTTFFNVISGVLPATSENSPELSPIPFSAITVRV